MNTRSTALLTGLLLTSLAPIATQAAQRRYHIEMIIFAHKPSQAAQEEQWTQRIDESTSPTQGLDLTTGNTASTTETTNDAYLLPRHDFRMKDAALHLKRNPNYQILVHQAWVQPFVRNRSYRYHWQSDASNATTARPLYSNWNLQGNLSININTYINTAWNMDFSVPSKRFSKQNNPMQQSMLTFYMRDQRRMKSLQLNYLDNPLIGVLVEAFPLKANEEPASDAAKTLLGA